MNRKFDDKLDTLLDETRIPFRTPISEAKRNVLARTASQTLEEERVYPLGKVLALAASLALILSFIWGYNTRESVVNNSEKAHIHVMPDGSEIYLNKGAKLRYHPWLWSMDQRNISFNGTAFFEVEEGSTFKVETPKGEVIVLGTSFSVVTGRDRLKVACKTGKVRVVSEAGDIKILLPGQGVEISESNLESYSVPEEDIDRWVDEDYRFDQEQLSRVFYVLEDLTGMKINYPEEIDQLLYSGAFSNSNSTEELLAIVCKPLGLTFAIDSTNEKILITKP